MGDPSELDTVAENGRGGGVIPRREHVCTVIRSAVSDECSCSARCRFSLQLTRNFVRKHAVFVNIFHIYDVCDVVRGT